MPNLFRCGLNFVECPNQVELNKIQCKLAIARYGFLLTPMKYSFRGDIGLANLHRNCIILLFNAWPLHIGQFREDTYKF